MLKLILFQLQFQSFHSCLKIDKTEHRTILREIITSVVVKKYSSKHNTITAKVVKFGASYIMCIVYFQKYALASVLPGS